MQHDPPCQKISTGTMGFTSRINLRGKRFQRNQLSRNAIIGSTRVALRAGKTHAIVEAKRNTIEIMLRTEISRMLLSVHRCTELLRPTLSRIPRITPTPVVRAVE